MQTWGQLAILLFVGAGALGAFGGSWLGNRTESDAASQLEITHPRFARLASRCEMRFSITPELIQGDRVELWVEAAFLHALSIERIMPDPEREEIRGNRVVFRIPVSAPQGPVPVVLQMKPNRRGWIAGRAGVVGGPELPVSQFVYP